MFFGSLQEKVPSEWQDQAVLSSSCLVMLRGSAPSTLSLILPTCSTLQPCTIPDLQPAVSFPCLEDYPSHRPRLQWKLTEHCFPTIYQEHAGQEGHFYAFVFCPHYDSLIIKLSCVLLKARLW